MTWRTSEDLKNDVRDIAGRFLRGLVRRFAITLTDGTKWRFSGMRSSSGGDETPDLEVFPGIGIYARPPNDGTGNPEAIALAVGGAKHRVVVATRDEATRQAALADDVQPGETCVYNGPIRIILLANGTAEIRLHGGVAIPLATKADLQALYTAFGTATIALGTGGAADVAAQCDVQVGGLGAPPNSWPVGTTVLKAQ